ncbi:hypothetical protein PR003_g14826 [Phytophthora rubi]|uniref:Uncharacterized protein n=1 Tax=Phytophthora rubi TaxID=129364 RepID=A0A6A4EY93_9STRA|nr:hypothetical protein PR001_g17478 [Phytophthora rubi]KAE9331808.1 hypothetical protein PR003_g14826 [Phytophthora rubi]
MHEATLHGQAEAVRSLLKFKADVNVANGIGCTPLIIACQRGRADIAKLLLDNGATVNRKTSDGRTALVLLKEEGHIEIIRLLLGHDVDVNVQDSDVQTALMIQRPRKTALGCSYTTARRSTRPEAPHDIAGLNTRYEIRAILETATKPSRPDKEL